MATEYSHGAPPVLDSAVEEQHGDHPYHYGLGHGHDDSDFVADHHAPRASDAHSNEHAGYASSQEHIDSDRRAHAGHLGQRLDLGHPQDRGTTRADAYSRTTDKNKSYKRR